MEINMMKEFNLEAFKSGQNALDRDGNVLYFVGLTKNPNYPVCACIESTSQARLFTTNGTEYATVCSNRDLVAMVSRHAELKKTWKEGDVWQVRENHIPWSTISHEPAWDEETDYRLHPHNDLIKAHKKGAKIEVFSYDGVSPEPYWYNDPNPAWDEHLQYRIKPTTKTVYEWLYKYPRDKDWKLALRLLTQDVIAAESQQYGFAYKKTGRSWEVEA